MNLTALAKNRKNSMPADNFPLNLTPKAIEMAKFALQETAAEDGDILQMAVLGGGCSGLKYALNFKGELGKNDIAGFVDGLRVSIDIFSLLHLNGATVDYEETLEGAGFKFQNPNAARTCGCGSSFS